MRVVTVHRGARDSYQVARSLYEADMLEALVTDLYWPGDCAWARACERRLPASADVPILNKAKAEYAKLK